VHTEHLQNVRIINVIAGWLVALAVTSLLLIALVAIGIVPRDTAGSGGIGGIIAQLAGFATGGYFAAFRSLRAPLLHGVAIGMTSLVAAAGLTAISALFFPGAQWASIGAGYVVVFLLTQMVAAALGALVGYNIAVRGRPGLGEPDVPAGA
jgi:hypothetical protein